MVKLAVTLLIGGAVLLQQVSIFEKIAVIHRPFIHPSIHSFLLLVLKMGTQMNFFPRKKQRCIDVLVDTTSRTAPR